MNLTDTTGNGSGFVLDRSVPPVSDKPRDINFPHFFETKTANGITLIVIEDKRLPLITSRFVFRSGSYLDWFAGADRAGLASFSSELLSKGTAGKSATQIAEEVDFLGANLFCGCDYDATYVNTYSLTKYFDEVFDILVDVLLNPAFAEEEIERLREQRLNSILSMEDDGDFLAERVFRRYVYGDTPYSLPAEGTRDTVRKLDRDGIVSFYKQTFVPSNLIAAFVGDITPDEALEKLNSVFPGSSVAESQPAEILLPEHASRNTVYLKEKKGAVQSSIRMGHLGIARSNPDFIPVNVMNTLLGGYFTSRINKNLREVNGYTYGAKSYFDANRYSGDFSVVTEVKNEITSETISEVLKEIEIMRSERVSEAELANVKNYISGSFPMQLETPNAVASKAINLKLHNLPDDYYNTYIRKINEITSDDIIEASRKYLHPDKLIISIAGNTDEISGKVKKFGEVNITED